MNQLFKDQRLQGSSSAKKDRISFTTDDLNYQLAFKKTFPASAPVSVNA